MKLKTLMKSVTPDLKFAKVSGLSPIALEVVLNTKHSPEFYFECNWENYDLSLQIKCDVTGETITKVYENFYSDVKWKFSWRFK